MLNYIIICLIAVRLSVCKLYVLHLHGQGKGECVMVEVPKGWEYSPAAFPFRDTQGGSGCAQVGGRECGLFYKAITYAPVVIGSTSDREGFDGGGPRGVGDVLPKCEY